MLSHLVASPDFLRDYQVLIENGRDQRCRQKKNKDFIHAEDGAVKIISAIVAHGRFHSAGTARAVSRSALSVLRKISGGCPTALHGFARIAGE